MVEQELVDNRVDVVRGGAWAAILLATRMASITSGVCTYVGSVLRAGAGFPTYSGRAMVTGTWRRGDCSPGVKGARMSHRLRRAEQKAIGGIHGHT
jgi:hypothetical protein